MESFHAHHRGADFEFILVLNGAAPEVKALGQEALGWGFPLLLIDASGRRPGAARNLGVAEARAPLLLFLDDDVECFQDLVTSALELFADPEVMAVGGANLTPPVSGALERATGYVMSSLLGAASMRHRYRVMPEGEWGEHGLILCNLAVRKSAFLARGGFALHLISNEENVLLQLLAQGGGKLIHSPRLAVYHRRRDRWAGIWEQAAKYGSGRAQNILLLPASLRALYFLPAALLLYLAWLPFGFQLPGALVPGLLYFFLSAAFTVAFALGRKDAAAWLALPLFPWIHCAYGVGFLRALGSWCLRRKKLLEHAF